MLEFVEVSFDQVALAVDMSGHGTLDLATPLGRDMGLCSRRFDLLDKRTGVIAPVCDHMACPFQAGNQVCTGHFVPSLSGRQRQADGQAGLIHYGMDLGAQSPARETDGVIRTPFFPPAAC